MRTCDPTERGSTWGEAPQWCLCSPAVSVWGSLAEPQSRPSPVRSEVGPGEQYRVETHSRSTTTGFENVQASRLTA